MDKKTAAERGSRRETGYPHAVCALEADGDPWKLLVMGRLSAQCTDARVNIVCQELFRRFSDARSMAECDIAELEEIVKPCGLFHVKAQELSLKQFLKHSLKFHMNLWSPILQKNQKAWFTV